MRGCIIPSELKPAPIATIAFCILLSASTSSSSSSTAMEPFNKSFKDDLFNRLSAASTNFFFFGFFSLPPCALLSDEAPVFLPLLLITLSDWALLMPMWCPPGGVDDKRVVLTNDKRVVLIGWVDREC